MRFVLSSFAILAWAFYEMSGGSDFRPPDRPVQKPKTQTASIRPAETTKTQPVKETKTEVAFLQPATLVAKEVAIATPRSATDKNVPEEAEVSQNRARLNQVRSSLSQGLTLLPDSNPEQGLSLTSLEEGATGLQQAPQEEVAESTAGQAPDVQADPALKEAPKDIREVTGTRVNMRDGPGTIYPVVAKLSIGHKLEVLSDSGTGWLRLRVLPEGHLGWISASLVSKAKP